jgi:hypothetical protein
MIDVTEALELLSRFCVEPTNDDPDSAPQRLVARALAALDLTIVDLYETPLRQDAGTGEQRPLSLGAAVAFRAADSSERAGASATDATLAAKRATRRYFDLISELFRSTWILNEAGDTDAMTGIQNVR